MKANYIKCGLFLGLFLIPTLTLASFKKLTFEFSFSQSTQDSNVLQLACSSFGFIDSESNIDEKFGHLLLGPTQDITADGVIQSYVHPVIVCSFHNDQTASHNVGLVYQIDPQHYEVNIIPGDGGTYFTKPCYAANHSYYVCPIYSQ